MLAIGTFIELPGYNFQNFFHGQTIAWDGRNYGFAGFGYSGSSVDLEGGNVDAQLVFAVNTLSLQIAKEASDNRHIVTIKTVWLNPDTLVPESNFMQDVFMVVHRRIRDYDGHTPVRRWVLGIARNVAYKYRGRSSRLAARTRSLAGDDDLTDAREALNR